VFEELHAGGARLQLLPQRAACLPDHGVLLVADAHIGKAQSFRKLGVPVPEATTAGTLARLDDALRASSARHIVFLGDLLHAARSRTADTLDAVAAWRARHPSLQLTLVRGNHDGHAGDPPADWGVQAVDEPFLLPGLPQLALCHHPDPRAGLYVLAGHVHPAASIHRGRRESLRLPCFHFGPAVGVLPAFGDFTGTHVLPRSAEDRVWVCAGDTVRALPRVLNSPT
jgi:DNA ligase-associated metallophosphoesterase